MCPQKLDIFPIGRYMATLKYLSFSTCLNSGLSRELPWKPEISTTCLFFLTLAVFSGYTDYKQGILVTIEILVNFYPIYMQRTFFLLKNRQSFSILKKFKNEKCL